MKPKPKPRGFAAMTPDRRQALASLGGIIAHRKGKAHEFSTAEAIRANAKARAGGKLHRYTHEEAVAAGRKGGRARAEKYKAYAEIMGEKPPAKNYA